MLKRKRTARGNGARNHRSGNRHSAAAKPAPMRRRFVISSARRDASKPQKTKAHGSGALASADKSSQKSPQNGHPNAAVPMPSSVDLTETVRTLLHLAQEHGYITYDDVNDLVPDGVSPDALDELYAKLRDHDIKVVEFADELSKPADAEEDQDHRLDPLDDPVRMYMNQMGKVPLLSAPIANRSI